MIGSMSQAAPKEPLGSQCLDVGAELKFWFCNKYFNSVYLCNADVSPENY